VDLHRHTTDSEVLVTSNSDSAGADASVTPHAVRSISEMRDGGWLSRMLFNNTSTQGLTLVHFSAQVELFPTQKHTLNIPRTLLPPPKHPRNNPGLHPLSHSRRLSSAEEWTSVSPCLHPRVTGVTQTKVSTEAEVLK